MWTGVPRASGPVCAIAAEWSIILTVLAGSLLGAWVGADWATRLGTRFHRVIAVALVGIAVVLLIAHDLQGSGLPVDSAMRTPFGSQRDSSLVLWLRCSASPAESF